MVMVRWLGPVLIAMTAGSACLAGTTTQRPLQTSLPWPLERGEWELAAGLLRRDGVAPPFFGSEKETLRSEWRATLVDATLGLGGGGEVRLRFGMQRFHEEGGAVETGIDDARVSFQYQLPVARLATGVGFEVKLPNAPDDHRLGTDEADILLTGIVGHAAPRWGWAGNLGFGIVGSPLAAGVQDDLLLFGLAGWLAPSGQAAVWTLLAEVNGVAASRFGSDFRFARAGARIGRRVPLDLSVRRGLTSESENWGLEAGLTFRLRGDL